MLPSKQLGTYTCECLHCLNHRYVVYTRSIFYSVLVLVKKQSVDSIQRRQDKNQFREMNHISDDHTYISHQDGISINGASMKEMNRRIIFSFQ